MKLKKPLSPEAKDKPPAKKQNNKKALIFGIGLVVFAFICVVFAFYHLDQDQLSKEEKITSLELQVNNLIEENAKIVLKEDEYKRANRGAMTLAELLKKSEGIYGDVEKGRTEGFLWIDRKAEAYLVTLGALNGLTPGSLLEIYEGDQKIGQATVEFPFDIISYVQPIKKSLKQFNGDYYRVVIVPDQPQDELKTTPKDTVKVPPDNP